MAARTVSAAIRALTEDRTLAVGVIACVQTHGSRANWHPHIHMIVTDGGFRADGTFVSWPAHEVAPLAEAFRRAVLRLFVRRGLFEDEDARAMLAWPHSGFHVHDGVWVSEDDRPFALRLARYYARNPVALDCHDREVLAHVAAPRDLVGTDIQQLMQGAVTARFGEGERPDAPLQWLSDNGSIYTALDTLITAERLHLVPITTPAASPESNGMSEAFVNTMRRDYFAGADLSTAALVLEQIPGWLADYNAVAPHSALGYQSPLQYRSTMLAAGPMS